MWQMSVVKACTGNDSLRGRVMRQNATVEVRASGFIVAVRNQPLSVKDTGNAIFRKMRPFRTKTVSKSREPLLKRVSHNTWKGPISNEASAIFNRVMNVQPKDYKIVNHPEIHVPSFKDLQIETRINLNPLIEWIREKVRETPGAVTPLGGKGTSKKEEEIIKEKRFIHPTYTDWCVRKGIKPYGTNRFSNVFLETCRELGIEVEKDRRDLGTVFKGVEIDPKVSQLNYKIGDGRDFTENENSNPDQQVSTSGGMSEVETTQGGPQRNEITKYLVQTPSSPNPKLDPNLYERYIQLLLVKSPEKIRLNGTLKDRLKEKDSGWTVEGLMERFKTLNKYDSLSDGFELKQETQF